MWMGYPRLLLASASTLATLPTMRVLQIGKFYPPAKGGMETVLELISTGLLARGHAVRTVCAATESVSSETPLGADGEDGRLIRCASLGALASQPLTLGLAGTLRRVLREFAPEIVMLHWPNPLAAFALRWARADMPRGSRLTVWYHADITRQRLGACLLGPLLRDLLTRADGVAVSTDSLRSKSSVLTPHDSKVHVIPFGIDADAWRLPVSAGRGPLLFVGRLVYYKGLDLLLDAMSLAPDLSLEIVGDGPLRGRLRRRIDEAGLGGRVRLHGELDDADLRRVMSGCGALVLPSLARSETFGLVQIEAMAAGLPVVSTQLPTGVAEVNVHGETGLIVPPGDVEALAEALRGLFADPARAEAMGAAGCRRVADLFDHRRMVDRLVDWYAELLAGGSGTS